MNTVNVVDTFNTVNTIVTLLQNTLKKRVWYQKLSDQDFNIGCGDLIFYKFRGGVVVWELKQYSIV